MKKNLFRIASLCSITALSVGLSLHCNLKSTPVCAEQHVDNYQEYKYAGSYYQKLDTNGITEGLNGTLRKRLSELILPSKWYTYSGSSEGTLGKILQSSDEDPTNNENMVLFYSRDSITKRASGGNTTDWNREHVWPQSLSNGHWGKEKAGADLLHIRPTWYTTNNKRGSIVYGDINKAGAQTYNNMVYAYINGSRFEPIDSVKGDVARILMYVWTAYYDYYNDTSLYLTNAIESYDTLLKWHTLDKPDTLEGKRNDFSEKSNQKNRNPFVDHPEYAWEIFGNSVKDSSVKEECKAAYPLQGDTPVDPPISSSSSSSSIYSESSVSSSFSSQESTSSNSEEPSSSANSESSYSSSSFSSQESSVSSSAEISSTSIVNSSNSKESTIPSQETSNKESSTVISSEESKEASYSSSGDSGQTNVEKRTFGCGGSLIGTMSLTCLITLVSLVFVLSKKK